MKVIVFSGLLCLVVACLAAVNRVAKKGCEQEKRSVRKRAGKVGESPSWNLSFSEPCIWAMNVVLIFGLGAVTVTYLYVLFGNASPIG